VWRFQALLVLSFYLVTWSSTAEAQAPVETNPSETKNTKQRLPAKRSDPAKNAEVERAVEEQRIQARSLLISLATDARTFRDPTLRSRSLARIADALWLVDPEQARLFFRKAWEASEVAYQERRQNQEEEIRQRKAKTGGPVAIDLPPDVRREVLRLAARHDGVLGEEFLEKLKAQNQESANSADSATRHSTGLDEASSQRLSLARELVSVDDIKRALQFADPALGAITIETVSFLAELRKKNAALADQRYAAMLASANTNLKADANTVSLLSSYIFTPNRFLTFNSGEVSHAYYGAAGESPADITPELRNAFFQTAAGILLRPPQLPANQDQSGPDIEAGYLVIKHLLPFFERFATRDIAEAVRGQFNALNSVVSNSSRLADNKWLQRGTEPEKAVDEEQSILNKIDRVKSSAERDELFMQLAHMAMSRGDIRARDFVSKIEDTEYRKQAQAFIDAGLAQNFVRKKLTERAIDLARKGELSHIGRIWVLTQCATQFAKTDRARALELVDEAALEAGRIDVSDPYRPRGLFAVANVLKSIDPARVWEATFDAVKAANSAKDFTGEDGELSLRFQRKGYSVVYGNDVPEFDVAGIFRELGTRNYEEAVELARGFRGEGPRALATIAIARAVLEPLPTGARRVRNRVTPNP
jgi:hypothetical protein